MKKLLRGVIALALALSMPVSTFASDTNIITQADSGTANTNVTYTVAPSYTVTIPGSVTLGSTATVSITDASVEKGKSVVVKLTGTSGASNAFTVADEASGETLTYTVTDGGSTTYKVGDTILAVAPSDTAKGSGEKTLTFTKPSDVVYAGEYTGTVIFTVSVE